MFKISKIYWLTIIFLLVGCASVKTSSELREDGTKIGIYQPPPAGFIKKRIAIIPFKDKTNQKHTKSDLGSQSVDIATTLLVNTERFEVIERDRLDALLVEQKLTGIVDEATAAKAGKVLGADYILTGAITDFEVERTQTGTSFGLPRIGKLPSLNIGDETYIISIFMAVDARVIKTETAEIFFAGSGEIRREEKASAFNFGVSGYNVKTKNAIKLDETAAGRQLRMALDKIIGKLVAKADKNISPQ
jgi:curli biogenesis system outer membrane secretion channel CsgG